MNKCEQTPSRGTCLKRDGGNAIVPFRSYIILYRGGTWGGTHRPPPGPSIVPGPHGLTGRGGSKRRARRRRGAFTHAALMHVAQMNRALRGSRGAFGFLVGPFSSVFLVGASSPPPLTSPPSALRSSQSQRGLLPPAEVAREECVRVRPHRLVAWDVESVPLLELHQPNLLFEQKGTNVRTNFLSRTGEARR